MGQRVKFENFVEGMFEQICVIWIDNSGKYSWWNKKCLLVNLNWLEFVLNILNFDSNFKTDDEHYDFYLYYCVLSVYLSRDISCSG